MQNISLNTFLAQHAAAHQLPQNLIDLMLSITDACGHINDKVRLGALAGILGEAGTGNVQGEDQKKLDVMANTIIIDALNANASVAGLASEEEDTYVAGNADGEYLVLFDPLDGSSNIDVNISVGTIFSILAHPKGAALSTESFLQKGSDQVAAGYVLYGPQTQLVFTLKHGVFVFTLNANNAFVLTQEALRIPEHTQEFAINMSNHRHWARPVQDYVGEMLLGTEGARGKNFNMRWVASMVAEVHRILMRGGVFMYPQDKRDPSKPGKLRLMYEANPMALLVAQAHGQTTNGAVDMLSIQPEGLHQRVPVFLGCPEEVSLVTAKHA